MMRIIGLFLLFFAGILFSTSYSEIPSLTDMIIESNEIVEVKLLNRYSYEKVNNIFTDYEFVVTNNLKGDLKKGDNFNITFLGGVIGNKQTHVPGSVSFKEKEEALLFLKRNENNLILASGIFSKCSRKKESFYCSGRKDPLTLKHLIGMINKLDKK